MAGDAFDVAGHTLLQAAPVPPPQLGRGGSSLGSFRSQLQLGVGGTGVDGCGSKSDLLQRQMRHRNSSTVDGCGVGLPLLQRSPYGGAIEKERLLIEKERHRIDHPHFVEKERHLIDHPHFVGPASSHLLEDFVQQLSPYRQTDLTSCGSSPYMQTERDLLRRQKRPIEELPSFGTSPYRQTDLSSFGPISNSIAALSTLTSDSGGGGGWLGGHGALSLTRALSLHTTHLSHTGPTLSPGQLSYAARAHGVVL
jgi:hypothetical protein